METIAVYWEARVKVYGITEKSGLAIGVLCFPVERLAYWSERIIELGDSRSRFELVTCHGTDTNTLKLSMVIESSELERLTTLADAWLDGEKSAQFMTMGPVDMVFLHGPHFQDRFGIAETAFTALTKKNISIQLSGCAGTSMYLVVAGGNGGAAAKILADTFLIPTIA